MSDPGGPRRVDALAVTAPGEMEVRPVEDRELGPGMVRLDTEWSGVSMGTEQTWFRGTNPALESSLDPELGLFVTGSPSQRYPVVAFGYMQVGCVVATRCRWLAEGSRVAMTYGHRLGHTADPLTERMVLIPKDLPARLGVLVAHLGPICANGLLHAAADATPAVGGLGDGVRGRVVVVTGAGFIGLVVAVWCRALGAAEVVVIDSSPERLAAAARLGATPLDHTDGDAATVVKERFAHRRGDRGADVVFQCRGRGSALHTALRCLRPQGTVIDLAFYDGPGDDLRLGEEFHHNGLVLRCAQIARVPRGLDPAWDRERLSRETLDLLAEHGPLIGEVVLTDDVAFADAPALFAEVRDRRRHVIGAVLHP